MKVINLNDVFSVQCAHIIIIIFYKCRAARACGSITQKPNKIDPKIQKKKIKHRDHLNAAESICCCRRN